MLLVVNISLETMDDPTVPAGVMDVVLDTAAVPTDDPAELNMALKLLVVTFVLPVMLVVVVSMVGFPRIVERLNLVLGCCCSNELSIALF